MLKRAIGIFISHAAYPRTGAKQDYFSLTQRFMRITILPLSLNCAARFANLPDHSVSSIVVL